MKGFSLGRRIWLVGLAGLVLAALACSTGGSSGGTTTQASGGGSATEASGGTPGGSTGGGSSQSDIAGSYSLAGKNPDGTSYTGTLDVEQKGDVYGLTWNIAGSTVVGVGLIDNGDLTVAYPSDSCVLATYDEEQGANTLNGRWIPENSTTVNPETATISNLTPQNGVLLFDLAGRNSDGSPYTGTMGLTVDGDLFRVAQKSGSTQLIGTGIEVGNTFVVSFGTSEGCGVVYYTVSPNKLDGTWAVAKVSTSLGSEVATK